MSDKEKSETSEKDVKDPSTVQDEPSNDSSEASSKTEPDNSLEEELKKCKEQLLRTAAEYENFRKRSEKEKESIYSDALSIAVLGILPIADSLEAAQASAGEQSEEYKQGIKLIKSQFGKALETLGIEAFGEVGDKFDPSIHNAISHIEDESEKEGMISKVFQKGYKSKTRIIRHAMVQVTN